MEMEQHLMYHYVHPSSSVDSCFAVSTNLCQYTEGEFNSAYGIACVPDAYHGCLVWYGWVHLIYACLYV